MNCGIIFIRMKKLRLILSALLISAITLGGFAATNDVPPLPPPAPKVKQELVKASLSYVYATNGLPPVVSSATIDFVAYQGSNATFNVSIVATNTPYYQWYNNLNAPIAGATNASYTITNVQPSNEGVYFVVVTNKFGEVQPKLSLAVLTTNILPQCLSGTYYAVLSWQYDFTNNPTVNGFNLYDGITSHVYTNVTPIAGMVTNGNITNLVIGQKYYVAGTAVDTNHLESVMSAETNVIKDYSILTKFNLSINMPVSGVPRIRAKVCPYQSVTITHSTNFVNWVLVQAMNADKYGNIICSDTNTPLDSFRFYRAATQ